MNYYKITNKDEKHYGMTYKTGLNVDVLPFNPSGDCKNGGIYFAREDILGFLDYGPWLRKVTIPNGEPVYDNPGKPVKWKSHRVILGKRERITLKVIKRLVKEGADIHADDESALRRAAYNGHLAVVKYLVSEGADIHAVNDYALQWAAYYGHLDVVKYLVSEGADIHAVNDFALRLAAGKGHLTIVKYLVSKGANIHADNDLALRWAAHNGHLAVVKYLKTIK